MRRLAPTFLRPMARLCVVHVIVIQDGVQTHENFAPNQVEGEASTSHGKDNRSLAIVSIVLLIFGYL